MSLHAASSMGCLRASLSRTAPVAAALRRDGAAIGAPTPTPDTAWAGNSCAADGILPGHGFVLPSTMLISTPGNLAIGNTKPLPP